jgi:energy-coupling factor transporter ATP-binding protein EcfA2
MAKFLTNHNIPYAREFGVDFTCTEIQKDKRARIDFMIVMQGVVVLLENDENQHDWVPTLCDVKRMGECYETMAVGGNTLPLVFMRFNPHKYRIDGQVQRDSTQISRRLRMLNEVLLNPDHQIFDKTVPLKIMHMFYDTNDGVPVVLEDYGHLRDCVIPCMF